MAFDKEQQSKEPQGFPATPNPHTTMPSGQNPASLNPHGAPGYSASPGYPAPPGYPVPPGVPAGAGVYPYSTAPDEDEISLVDLFIVLLKGRRLIIGIPLLAGILAAVVLFVFPALGILSFRTYSLQAVVASVQIPPALRDQVGLDIPGLAVAYGQEFTTVIDSVVRNNLKVDNLPLDPKNLEFRTYVAKSFIGKGYKVSAVKEGIRFEVQVKDKDAGKRFLEDMVSRVDARIRKQIAERATVIYASMEELYKEAGPTSALSDTVKQLITASRTYMKGDLPVLVSVAEPEIFIEPQKRALTFTVVVIAAGFLAIFLAFVLEAIEKVRKDPDTMGRIRQALGKKGPED